MKIDEAIEQSKKYTALLIEFKNSQAEETAKYIVERLDDRQFVITDKISALHCGSIYEIEKFIKKRNLTNIHYRCTK